MVKRCLPWKRHWANSHRYRRPAAPTPTRLREERLGSSLGLPFSIRSGFDPKFEPNEENGLVTRRLATLESCSSKDPPHRALRQSPRGLLAKACCQPRTVPPWVSCR